MEHNLELQTAIIQLNQPLQICICTWSSFFLDLLLWMQGNINMLAMDTYLTRVAVYNDTENTYTCIIFKQQLTSYVDVFVGILFFSPSVSVACDHLWRNVVPHTDINFIKGTIALYKQVHVTKNRIIWRPIIILYHKICYLLRHFIMLPKVLQDELDGVS